MQKYHNGGVCVCVWASLVVVTIVNRGSRSVYTQIVTAPRLSEDSALCTEERHQQLMYSIRLLGLSQEDYILWT